MKIIYMLRTILFNTFYVFVDLSVSGMIFKNDNVFYADLVYDGDMDLNLTFLFCHDEGNRRT